MGDRVHLLMAVTAMNVWPYLQFTCGEKPSCIQSVNVF